MSEVTQPVSTEQAPKKKFIKKKEENFSMNSWKDERAARRFIKENLLCIQQNAENNGIKAHFSRTKDNGDGTSTMEVQFAENEVEVKNGVEKKKIVFTGNNFIRITFDPNRKFPKSDEEDASKKKESTIATFVKWRP